MLHAHEHVLSNGIGAAAILMPTEGRGRVGGSDTAPWPCATPDLPLSAMQPDATRQQHKRTPRSRFWAESVNRRHYRDAHDPCARSVLDQVDGHKVNLSPHD